jgi:hypothetical protein
MALSTGCPPSSRWPAAAAAAVLLAVLLPPPLLPAAAVAAAAAAAAAVLPAAPTAAAARGRCTSKLPSCLLLQAPAAALAVAVDLGPGAPMLEGPAAAGGPPAVGTAASATAAASAAMPSLACWSVSNPRLHAMVSRASSGSSTVRRKSSRISTAAGRSESHLWLAPSSRSSLAAILPMEPASDSSSGSRGSC